MSFLGKTYWYPTPDFGAREIGVAAIDGTTPTMFGVYWEDQERHAKHWMTGNRTALRECPSPECMQDLLEIWAAKRQLKVAYTPGPDLSDTVDFAEAMGHKTEPEILGKGLRTGQNEPELSTELEVTVASCSKIPVALERVGLVVVKPATLEAADAAIRYDLDQGCRGECRTGLMLVWKFEMSGQKVSAFVTEASKLFFIAERQIYRYLAAGRLLLSPEFASLPEEFKKLLICETDKLEMLAPVAKKSAGTLRFFLEHNDPRAMTREELAEKVHLYMTKLLSEADRAAAAKAVQGSAEAKAVTSIRHALKPLGAVEDTAMKAAVQRVGPARCFDAGLRLMAAAVDAQMDAGPVDPATVDGWKTLLRYCLEELEPKVS